MPPVGCAPDHETAICCRPCRLVVWLTSSVTVRVSTTLLATPPTNSSRLMVSVLVKAGVAAWGTPASAAPGVAGGPGSPGRAATTTTPTAATRITASLLMAHPGSAVAPGDSR
jgi:hypothetical protein